LEGIIRRNVNMKAWHLIAFYLVILLIVGTGWVKNIIKLSNCDFKAPYKAEVIHAVGLVPPVGMITGWLNPGK
jgi:hypothetical protein